MLKDFCKRFICSFCCAVSITLIIYMFMTLISGFVPMLPEYMDRFSSESAALVTQLFFIGLMSAALGGGTVIMEIERMSLLMQSFIYFIFSSVVWISVGCFCWGLHKYVQTMVSLGISYMVSYVISWVIQYRICKRNIEDINARLEEIKQN